MFLLTEQISKDELKKYIKELYNYSISKLDKIDKSPKLVLKYDQQNADDIFGKTGYYDPAKMEICLFLTDRHPKDVLRSFAHELVHHEQNCRGDTAHLDIAKTANDPAYASHDKDLREMEREAFERGNMIFRDWCDMKKMKRSSIMSVKKEQSDFEFVEKLEENNHPHPELFKEKDRLFKERMNKHEDLVFQELMKRIINEK